MSKDKKPCSSCPKSVDLPLNGSIKDVIKIFKDKAQTVEPRIGQQFESNGIGYRMKSIFKTNSIPNGKNISTELLTLNIIYKFDEKTKTYKQNSWFTSSETTTKNLSLPGFYNNPTQFINMKNAMINIGIITANSNSKNVKSKSKSQSKGTDCCDNADCGGVLIKNTYSQNGLKYFNCYCTTNDKTNCYTRDEDDNCTSINCNEYNGVTYLGTINYS